MPLSVTTGSTVRNYGRDRLGSITGLTNNSETLQRSYVYDPYGSIVAETGSQPNSLKFTVGREDPTSDWYTLSRWGGGFLVLWRAYVEGQAQKADAVLGRGRRRSTARRRSAARVIA